MVEIVDIKDRDSLEAWLKDQPQEVSVWIASRAAARGLPVWWNAMLTEDWARERELTALPVLRSLLISSVAALVPTVYIKNAVPFTLAAGTHAAGTHAAGTHAAGTHAAGTHVADIHAAVQAAANAHVAATAVWRAIRTDAERAAGDTFPDALPLWPDGAWPLAEQWAQIKARLANSSDLPDWQFWIDWYDAQLAGRTMLPDPERTWDMLEQIALIDPAK